MWVAALVPAVAAAFLSVVPLIRGPQPETAVTPAQVQARAMTGTVVGPRPDAATPTRSVLREVSMHGEPVAFGTGALEGSIAGAPPQPFLLEHTDVHAQVTGFVSAVTVTQEFKNPFSSAVEAVYVFPLPDDAAVNEMELRTGSRVIRATIQKREDARRKYEQAKSQGRQAALLDQERPNIFTQSVANLLPSERVTITLRYVAPLHYDDGVYTFNFPMVVGPRYMPGNPLAGESQGTGTKADTDRVMDASRISPPELRSGRDVSVTVHVEAGSPIEDVSSVSHRLLVNRGPTTTDVALTAEDRIPNRDFVMRWRVAGTTKRAALLASGGPGGMFALMLMPEERSAEPAPVPKEMIFVIDTSCSMSGAPLAAAKRAMSSAIEQMNPDDTFMLIDFASQVSAFHATPLPNLPQHVQRALSYLAALPAAGGTNQLEGIEAALQLPEDPKRLREVLLMTDGFIGNETEIFAAAQRDLGSARIFGLGIGSSVNHYLLSRLSQVGRGFYQYVRPDEDAEPAVERFVRRIERPLLTDVQIDWGGLEVSDVMPQAVPDLFDAQPLVLMGRYRQAGRATVVVSGMRGGRRESARVEVELPAVDGAAPGLKEMWARARIDDLMMEQNGGERADIVRDVTSLGLEYHLVTQYTSLVAVDDRPVVATAGPTVAVPTEIDGRSGGEGDHEYWHAPPPKPTVPAAGHKSPALTQIGSVDHRGFIMEEARAAEHEAGIGLMALHGTQEVKGGDDEFSREFGGGSIDVSKTRRLESKSNEALEGAAKRTVYIPPAPGGSTSEVRESLGQSDIMEVVKGNISAVQACLAEQRSREPGVGGKIVVKWTILTSGKTTRVEIISDKFKDTYLAGCLRSLIKSWVFPRTKTQGDPVVFPFKF